ncbi:antirestriction protein [Mycolicibacterium agri]|uniref:Antirestriction protein n=1 Tax=Mycolicibacterium agri TaxID=36811 RepID=A0A2A7MNE4_MYCAG|nr:antirestriction protein ArdA [Mycolicibacterium agri]PEG33322.1 antirestriction protein [Mycolicibacterium agri]GFG50179.1 hypothetical protein MAGR_16200 [Mycolicibacterium agri]
MNEQQPQTNPGDQPSDNSEALAGHETEPRPSPRIYIASLADYNNGYLHGVWLDAAREPEAIHDDIQGMLAESRQPDAEEFAIHDYDNFGVCQIHEYDSIELVSRIARGIQEHGLAFAAWAEVNEGSPERFDDFAEAYLGHFDSLTDYADHLLDDLGYTNELSLLSESVRRYLRFDTAAMGRDMLFGGDIHSYPAPDGGVWIFDARM